MSVSNSNSSGANDSNKQQNSFMLLAQSNSPDRAVSASDILLGSSGTATSTATVVVPNNNNNNNSNNNSNSSSSLYTPITSPAPIGHQTSPLPSVSPAKSASELLGISPVPVPAQTPPAMSFFASSNTNNNGGNANTNNSSSHLLDLLS